MQEIDKLSSFQDDPKGAMISFCKDNLGRPVVWKVRDSGGNDKGALGALFSFYFFTAAVYHGKVSYGAKFAKFIEDEKLGTLISTPALVNYAYHSDHLNQVWIWMPNLKALETWWKANQSPRVARKDY